MSKYRKRPVVIEAMRFDGHNYDEISEFMDSAMLESPGRTLDLIIPTLEGDMRASPGDWIIKDVAGEFYPCKLHIFEATYEPVED